jgi:hypothetical protein
MMFAQVAFRQLHPVTVSLRLTLAFHLASSLTMLEDSTTRQQRYSFAFILLLSWECDDLGVSREITELRNAFEQWHNFRTTERKKILPHGSHLKLVCQLLEFLGT